MASFKIKCSKSKNQQTITIRQIDNVDLSGVSAVVASVYTDDLGTADNTYTLSASELTALKAGSVDLSATNLLGTASPDDDFYLVSLNADSGSYVSDSAGVAITLEAKGKAYNKQIFVDVYSPDYKVDRVLHTAHMIVQQMDAIEVQETALQKRIDFTTRLATLKQMLNYS